MGHVRGVRATPLFAAAALGLAVAGCTVMGYPAPIAVPPTPTAPPARASGPPASGDSYEQFGRRYTTLSSSRGYREIGLASWYGEPFHGRITASGELFDMYALTAAHRTLPLPTCVEVRRLDSGRRVRLRVNDRGPFDDDERRIIDLSYSAARSLDLIEPGTARVEVIALEEDIGC